MKTYRVKHYRSRIYNPIRGKILKGILIGVIALALFGIGWFAYEPLMEVINNRNEEIIAKDPVPEKPQEPAYEPVPEEFLEKATVAVTVPEGVLYNAMDYHAFLKALGDETTAVVIDMKTRAGTVTYNSKQQSVINAGAISENAVPLESRVKTARDMGFDIILRICAFEDSTAPYNAVDMAIRYESEEGLLWLDDSVDNGGKPWLNPYSDTAQKYILDIVYDAIDLEADAVLLEGVRFPDNGDLDYAYFGMGAEGVSKTEALEQFTKRIYSGAVVTDTNIIIGYDSYKYISESEAYGEGPFSFSADGFAPYVNLNEFIGKKINSDFYYRNKPEETEEISEFFMKVYNLSGDISELKIMPVVTCEGFTKLQLGGIWPMLDAMENVSGYILVYDENYFTGVPAEPEVPEEQEEAPQRPQQPQTPTQPAQPEQPTQPSQPAEPETPVEPEQPEEKNPGPVIIDPNGGEEVSPGLTVKDYT